MQNLQLVILFANRMPNRNRNDLRHIKRNLKFVFSIDFAYSLNIRNLY